MFSVGGISFANGVYHNQQVNGAECAIMQSSAAYDAIDNYLDENVKVELSREELYKVIYAETGYNMADLLSYHKRKIEDKITKILSR